MLPFGGLSIIPSNIIMKIAFVLLAHNFPELLIQTVRHIAGNGHYACIHYDLSSPQEEINKIRESLKEFKEQVCIISECHCKWGEWSLVQAPLASINKIREMEWKVDYVHLMSGVDTFIKPFRDLEKFLTEYPYDFIESVNINERQWVVDGLEIERFIHTYPYNYITQRELFEEHLNKQIAANACIPIPREITPHMGSQWWTLRWQTCMSILDFMAANQHVIEYFKLCWIPDESFFQSVIRCVSPKNEVKSTQLIFHSFSQNGRPFLFMNGHENLIEQIPHFLIRKVSPESQRLLQFINEKSLACDQERKITPETLISVKAKLDYQIKKAGDLTVEVPWSPPSINHGGAHNSIVLILIHDGHHNPLEVASTINEYEHVAYLGRPFMKNKNNSIYKLLVDSNSLKTNYYQPNPLTPEHWQAIQAKNPQIKLYVVSYVPEEDWLEHNKVLQQSRVGFIILQSGNPLRDALIQNKLQFEKVNYLRAEGCHKISDLAEVINITGSI